MVAQSPLRMIAPSIVDAALGRLGIWESADERPSRQVLGQQLELPPSPLCEFAVHRDQPEQLLRFQGCQAERQFWLDVLPDIEGDGRKVTRFQQCGGYAFVAENEETGRLYLQGETCKLRICPVCRRRIQAKASTRVLHFMEQHPSDSWQFHTFTLKHSSTPLSRQLDRLVKSFRKLRQRALWKRHVITGYAVIEVTFHPAGSYSTTGRFREDDEWHPHLHVVARTDFIPWGELRAAWLSVTGDSDAIDCRVCDSATHAAHYVAKYVGKPPDVRLEGNRKRAAEYYHSLKARRLLMPFGDTAKHSPPPRAAPPRSHQVARFEALLKAARAGDYPARFMLAAVIVDAVPGSFLGDDAPRYVQQKLFDRGPP